MGYTDRFGRANETAEMTSYAFLTDDTRFAVLTKADSLVTSVHTRDKAPSATDTFLAVYLDRKSVV